MGTIEFLFMAGDAVSALTAEDSGPDIMLLAAPMNVIPISLRLRYQKKLNARGIPILEDANARMTE